MTKRKQGKSTGLGTLFSITAWLIRLTWRVVMFPIKLIFKSPRARRTAGYIFAGFIGLVLIVVLLQGIGVLPSAEERQQTETAEAITVVAMSQATNSAATATEEGFVAATETALASITPTLTATPSNTPTASNTPLPSDTPLPTNTPTITPTRPTDTPPPTNIPVPTIAPTLPPETILYVQDGDTRARSCPRTNNTDCPVMDTLAIGTEVTGIRTVTGDSVSGSDVWWEVRYQGRTLFIHSALLATTRLVIPSSGGSSSGGSGTSSGGQNQSPATSPPQGLQWTCFGDLYNCPYFQGRCDELRSYWNACPGDPSMLDNDNNGHPCEIQCPNWP